ncbi:hypothetical protein KFL_000060670 [Klebsormidium nitens]|uniref:GATA-type transcription activator N-terminal domain-containing protein n=1 Tax=Klebsormidium nitens TaxID=105231 RepID=A0A0U9HI26_KLENI|nr:hypothetical protein KFL_000060670 [Klebsormidium nitens]|eukprot:GAQ78001.1 hypothetical protein KFL_000060670 [Klebsormidium nitens]
MAQVAAHAAAADLQILSCTRNIAAQTSSSASAFAGRRIPTCTKFNVSEARRARQGVHVCAAKKDDKPDEQKQGFLSGIAEALDFAAVRSEKDRDLIDDARAQVRSGERMSREQYGALRRKIGGTYRDFFKDSVDVKGAYVEDGWVDKTCYICKKDTSSSPRQKDSWGRYAHVECAANKKQGGFLSKLFGK